MVQTTPLLATAPVPEAPGIYLIHSRGKLASYVGSAFNLNRRFASHRGRLMRGTWTYRLKDAIARHGCLYFSVLELCDAELLVVREQAWIDTLAPTLNVVRAIRSHKIPDTTAAGPRAVAG